MDNNFIEITALWEGVSKSGNRYLRGKLGGATVFVFFTQEKKSDRSPDARIMIAPGPDKQEKPVARDDTTQRYSKPPCAQPVQQSLSTNSGAIKNDYDDIPF